MLAAHFRIANPSAHRALADAQVLAQLLPHLLRLAAQQHEAQPGQQPAVLPSALAELEPSPQLVRFPPPLMGLPQCQHQAVHAALAALAQQRCGSCAACTSNAPAAGPQQQQQQQQQQQEQASACAPELLTPEDFCLGVAEGWVAAVQPSAGAGGGQVVYCSIRSSRPGGAAAGGGGKGGRAAAAAAWRPVRLLLQDVSISEQPGAEYAPEQHARRATFDLHLSCGGERLPRLAAALHALADAARSSDAVGLLAGGQAAERRLHSSLGQGGGLVVKVEGRAVAGGGGGGGMLGALRRAVRAGAGGVALELTAEVYCLAAGAGAGAQQQQQQQQAAALQRVDVSALEVDCERRAHVGLQRLLPLGAWCHCVAEPRCAWVNSSGYGVKLVATHVCLARQE